jgi:hypothetical protein
MVFNAIFDTVIGGITGTAGVGRASDGGGGSGRVPSSCGRPTGSGWNFGGTGGCSTGVGRLTTGGTPTCVIGCNGGAGAGRGRLTGGGGEATGFDIGALDFTACAITGDAGAGTGRNAATACVLVLCVLVDATWPACP